MEGILQELADFAEDVLPEMFRPNMEDSTISSSSSLSLSLLSLLISQLLTLSL
jgi:hypothetical protein